MSALPDLSLLGDLIDPMALRTYLDTALLRRPCEHLFYHTETFARASHFREQDLAELLTYLKTSGSLCDCQVAAALHSPGHRLLSVAH